VKVAVVGNRKGWTYDQVERVLGRYVRKGDIIVSGGAEGVDTYAEQFAKKFGLQTMVFYPDKFAKSPVCYYIRNEQIALAAELMIAFDNKKDRSGTQNAIRFAKRYGKYVLVFKDKIGDCYDAVSELKEDKKNECRLCGSYIGECGGWGCSCDFN
jgi:predicted Rossmann fold nucleotide-binding protein DprA/Smf involved in DNA uptake